MNKIKCLKSTILTVVTVLFFISGTTIAYNGDADQGKAKSANCVACHNADGNSVNPEWPKLAGQDKNYLIKQMIEFRKGMQGKRNNPIMYGMAVGLSDTDIQDLAAFYSEQEITPGKARADLLELGKQIYRAGNIKTGVPACSSCHGVHGEGNSLAGFPRLSYQHAQYTILQLKSFKQGTRKNSANGMMADIASSLSDGEIEAVSSYIQGLH